MAANLLLTGIDPIGVPWMQAPDQVTRDVWMAVANRAADMSNG